MPRVLPLITGLAVATAVTYKFKNDLLQDQSDIKNRLNQAKTTLEKAVTEEEQNYKRGPSYLTDSQKYVNDRLVPSVKDNWNSQIMNAAQSLVKVDIGSKVKHAFDVYIVENVQDLINNNKK